MKAPDLSNVSGLERVRLAICCLVGVCGPRVTSNTVAKSGGGSSCRPWCQLLGWGAWLEGALTEGALQRAGQVDTKPASDILAGAVARAASQSTIHPLDTLKVRMQAGGGVSKFARLVPPAGVPPTFAGTSMSAVSHPLWLSPPVGRG